jgi:protein SCO1/2
MKAAATSARMECDMKKEEAARRGSRGDENRNGWSRRDAVILIGAGAGGGMLLAPHPARASHATDMTGTIPQLSFTMTRASDSSIVSAADYKGKIVLLYFGYTFCPDVCPTTLLNITLMMKKLGPQADRVRVLFVTVDPERDTLDILKQYTGAFAPQVVGLRGTDDALAGLAKRCRVAYSVTPASKGHPYSVTHSAAVYVFDRNGDIKLLFSGLATDKPDINGFADDLRAMIGETNHMSLWSRLVRTLF